MDWNEFEKETRKLANMIDYKPDMIVGIARGGVIPATLLAKMLEVADVYIIKMHRDGNERLISADIFTDIDKKNILLVEDMIETGKSLIAGKKFLEERGASVRTACLYTMPMSEIQPDYFLRQENRIAQFPWNG